MAKGSLNYLSLVLRLYSKTPDDTPEDSREQTISNAAPPLLTGGKWTNLAQGHNVRAEEIGSWRSAPAGGDGNKSEGCFPCKTKWMDAVGPKHQSISISGLARIQPVLSAQLQRLPNTSWQIVSSASCKATTPGSTISPQESGISSWEQAGGDQLLAPESNQSPEGNNIHPRSTEKAKTSFYQARNRTPMHGPRLEDAGGYRPAAHLFTLDCFHQP